MPIEIHCNEYIDDVQDGGLEPAGNQDLTNSYIMLNNDEDQ